MNAAAIDDIVLAIRNVRRFTEDVGKLLATARDMLEKAGWGNPNSTQAISVSTSINLPYNWLPQDAFWFAFNSGYPAHMLYVSVVFDDIKTPSHLDQPLVAAGYVRFKAAVGKNWSFKWARPARGATIEPDGDFRDVPLQNFGNPSDFERAEAAFWPLRQIESSEILEIQVVRRLLKTIESKSQATGQS